MPKFAEPLPTAVVLPTGPVTRLDREAIERALSDLIPAGKTGALIGVATHEGMVLGVAARVNQTWTVGAEVEKRWGGRVTGRVMVVGAW